MLKLIGVGEAQEENIIFDYYVPFKIRNGFWDVSVEKTVYWRTGDLDQSFIEIGLGAKSGVIRSITLVQSNIVRSIEQESELINLGERGSPIFEIQNFKDNGMIDFMHDFEVNILLNKIIIWLMPESKVVNNYIRLGRSFLGLNYRDELCCIAIENLNQDEIEILREAFKLK